MSKRDEFITIIRTLRAASPTITDKQRIGLLQQATQNYGLSAQEATEILKDLNLVVGEEANYFDVLGFSIEDIQSLNEDAIVNLVEAAHKKSYRASLSAGGRIRPDGKTEEQWRTLLNQARDTLIDAKRRREHINALEHDEVDISVEENVDTIFKSPDIPETTIQELSHNGVTSDVDAPVETVFIPAGEFQMGSRDEKASDSEKPVHTVYVDAFYMDKYLVTNEQYKAFLEVNPQWRKPQLFKNYIPTDYHDGAYLKDWHKTDYPNDANFYAISPRRNPFAGANTMQWVINNFRSVQSPRVLRGGSWLMDAQGVRVAYRFRGSPTDTYSAFGFRCVRPVTP